MLPNVILPPITKTAMPFPFAALAGGLGAAFNFISQNRNSQQAAEMSKYNTDATIAYSREAADKAYQRDLEQWHRSNSYNDPSNQMLRLRAAGLNPMMAYGSGAIGANSAAQSPSMSVPRGEYRYQAAQLPQVDTLGIMQSVQSLSLGKVQIDKLKAEKEVAQAEATIRLVAALKAEKSIPNLDAEVKASLETLLGNALKTMTEGKLADKAFEYDLDSRKAMMEKGKAEAALKAKELKELYPLSKEMQEINRELLKMQKDKSSINLKMLQDYGIDENAPQWLKAIIRNDPEMLKKLLNWLKSFTN